MMKRLALAMLLLAVPASATRGVPSEALDGFKSEQVFGLIYRNPADAIQADPRFEPEQRNPSISIVWTRDDVGHLWADVVLQNPDTGIFREMNKRFEFSERDDGQWQMVGYWSRWKCLANTNPEWTTEACTE